MNVQASTKFLTFELLCGAKAKVDGECRIDDATA